MQAQLRFLLLSAVIVIGLVLFGSWYFGANLLHLAFFAEGRSDPYLVLDFRTGGAGDGVGYEAALEASDEEWRADFSAHWRLANVLEGRVADEWPVLTLSTYREAAHVVQFVTSPAYRTLSEEDPNFAHRLLGSFETLKQDPSPVLVVWLAKEAKEGMYSLTRLITDLPDSASIVWQGEVSTVSVSEDVATEWQHGVIVGFDDLESAVAYATEENLRVERELVRSRVEAFLLAIYVNAAVN